VGRKNWRAALRRGLASRRFHGTTKCADLIEMTKEQRAEMV